MKIYGWHALTAEVQHPYSIESLEWFKEITENLSQECQRQSLSAVIQVHCAIHCVTSFGEYKIEWWCPNIAALVEVACIFHWYHRFLDETIYRMCVSSHLIKTTYVQMKLVEYTWCPFQCSNVWHHYSVLQRGLDTQM